MRRTGPTLALACVAAMVLIGSVQSAPASTSSPAPICGQVKKGCSLWAVRDKWAITPSIYTATFIPKAQSSSIHVYAAWIRTTATDLALYPGYKGPGPSSLSRGPEMVPVTARKRLLATFNSGFYEADNAAGFYAHSTLYYPMVRGLATVVRYRDGTVDVLAWTGGSKPGPDVVMARQNLTLLVSRSAPTTRSLTNSLWGSTLNGVPAVWRTALGIDATGNLIYAAAPAQTSASMAKVMVALHCVRAMQLDINPAWPIFVTYQAPNAQGPSLFVPNSNQIAGRFLYPSTKDFFAVYQTVVPGEQQPW